MNLNKAIQRRKSIKRYKTKKPNWRAIIECIDAARYAPMAGNNFSLKFILVQDPKTIQKLADAAQQQFVSQAPYVVVVCSDPKRITNLYEKRGKRYLRQQAGAAIQNFLLKIEEKGLATCWVGDLVDYLVREAINAPADTNVEAIFPIGYAAEKPKKKRKTELDQVLYFDRYKQKEIKPTKTINV